MAASSRYEVPVSKYRHLVFAAKISAVAFFSVGIQFFIQQQFILAIVLMVMAVVISLWPVRVDVGPDPVGAAAAVPEGAGKAIHPLEEL